MSLLKIIDNGKQYELDDECLKYFSMIYADCELNNNNELWWDHHINELIEASKICNHEIDDNEARAILEEYKEDYEKFKSYQQIDYIQIIKKYFNEINSRSVCRRTLIQGEHT